MLSVSSRAAIVCLSLSLHCTAEAVGRDKFGPDAEFIMKLLVGTLEQGLSSDDPQHHYVVEACARICKSLQQGFLPYLPYVVPALLKSAAIEDAAFIANEGEKTEYDNVPGYESQTVSIHSGGNKKIYLNSALLQEKSTAVRMLYEYAETLKEGFFPYLEATAKVLVPLLSYRYNEQVRIASMAALPAMIKCATKALQNDHAKRDEFCRELFAFMFEPVVHAMKVEYLLDNLNSIIDALSEVGQRDTSHASIKSHRTFIHCCALLLCIGC